MKNIVFTILSFCLLNQSKGQDSLTIVNGDIVDKRYTAAAHYLNTHEKELRDVWAKGFFTNKKARKEFLNYYDSIKFTIAPCIAYVDIFLPNQSIQPDIILPVKSVFGGETTLYTPFQTFTVDSSVMKLVPWVKTDFELVFSVPYKTNLLVELFNGGISSPQIACARRFGMSIKILFVFDINYNIAKVLYQQGIVHYN